MTSSAVYPKVFSEPLFQLTIVPVRSVVVMESLI